MNKKDLTNQKFGLWTVIKENGRNSCGQILWLCECSCNNHTHKNIVGSTLINGKSKSCGCQRGKNNKLYNKYDLTGEYGIGYDSNGKEFYFDLKDYGKIKNYCWRINEQGYVISQYQGKTIRFHRVIFPNLASNMQVDHIYHITYDNRKSELRVCTNQQNSMNKKVKGVYYSKEKNKYVGNLTYNGKKYFKYFNTFEEAKQYREYLEEIFFKDFKYKT